MIPRPKKHKNILLLMMGGSGTRFGANIPKQFIQVQDRPIFGYIVDKYERIGAVDAMVVVCHGAWLDYTKDYLESVGFGLPFNVVAGGASRSESVRNGLDAAKEFATDGDVILIHDATHPYVDEENMPGIIVAARNYGGATLGQCQYDTVYAIDKETGLLKHVIPREEVVSGASPEAFRFELISKVYHETPLEELENYTSAGALALAYDIPMMVVPTDLINLKITYRHDMEVFKKLFHGYYF